MFVYVFITGCNIYRQYNTIQYKTCNVPYVTRMLFVGAEIDSSSTSLDRPRHKEVWPFVVNKSTLKVHCSEV